MNKRQQDILERLNKTGSVQVSDLADQFGVSEMTIRRDLCFLEDKSMVHRTHGGAHLVHQVLQEPSFNNREEDFPQEKRDVAKRAASMIREGATIALDCGTTSYELCKHLLGYEQLTIITTSIRIAMLCVDHPHIHVLLPGGELRPLEGSLVGSDTCKHLSMLFSEQFFLGIGGLDLHAGVTEYNTDDAAIKQVLITNTKQVIGIMDASKLNKVTFAKVCDISALDTLIVNGKIPERYREVFHSHGITVVNPREKE